MSSRMPVAAAMATTPLTGGSCSTFATGVWEFAMNAGRMAKWHRAVLGSAILALGLAAGHPAAVAQDDAEDTARQLRDLGLEGDDSCARVPVAVDIPGHEQIDCRRMRVPAGAWSVVRQGVSQKIQELDQSDSNMLDTLETWFPENAETFAVYFARPVDDGPPDLVSPLVIHVSTAIGAGGLPAIDLRRAIEVREGDSPFGEMSLTWQADGEVRGYDIQTYQRALEEENAITAFMAPAAACAGFLLSGLATPDRGERRILGTYCELEITRESPFSGPLSNEAITRVLRAIRLE